MAEHNILGRIGEEKAANLLIGKGYRVLERNWKIGDLEMDIIAQDGDTIVFVEVKTRKSDRWGNPEQAVDEIRKRRLTACANAYLKYNRLDNPWRFDIISIVLNDERYEVNHIEEAFQPRAKYVTKNTFNPELKWRKTFFGKRK